MFNPTSNHQGRSGHPVVDSEELHGFHEFNFMLEQALAGDFSLIQIPHLTWLCVMEEHALMRRR
jgi:hypothetical protein